MCAHAAEMPELGSWRNNRISDALGYNWDVNNRGMVNDGSNDCFDGAMQLVVSGNSLGFNDAKMSQDGKVMLLTVTYGQWQISRYIQLDTERGLAIFVDAFQNTQDGEQALQANVRTNLGSNAQQILLGSAKPYTNGLPEKEYGIFGLQSGNRPSCMFLIRGNRAKVDPVLNIQNNRTVDIAFNAAVPGGKQVAFMTIIGQRASLSGEALVDEFEKVYKRRLIDIEIPDEFRGDIQNFAFAPADPLAEVREALLAPLDTVISDLDVERGEQDMVIIDESARIVGRVEGEGITVNTRYGSTDLRLADVALITGRLSGAASSTVYLRNGEILVGEVTMTDVKLVVGKDLSLPLSTGTLTALVLHADAKKDASIGKDELLLLRLRDGSRLSMKMPATGKLPLQLCGPLGTFELPLNKILLMKPLVDPLPHLVISMKDGSTVPVQALGAPLKAQSLRFGKQELPPTMINGLLHLSPQMVKKAQEQEDDEAEAEEPPSPFCELEEDFRLVGNLSEPTLEIVTGSGRRTLAISELRLIERIDDSPAMSPEFNFHLGGGSLISGKVLAADVPFATEDLQVRVPVILLRRLVTQTGVKEDIQ